MRNRIPKLVKTLICFLLIGILVGSTVLSTSSASERTDVESKVENYIKEHESDIAGLATIIVNQNDSMSIMKGYSNIEEQVPVTEDTVFEWASVSKVLIWISVLQLAEKGKLDLHTDIEMYLPNEFHFKTNFEEPVTLQHLMHHSAGFDDSYTDLMIHRPARKVSLEEALEAADVTQVFPPGDVVAYSNYGSGLAAYVVEEVSGLDYREYVRKNIFEPLHMTKTAIDPEQDDNKWVKEQRLQVQGYSNELQVMEPNIYSIPLYPAGSVMGTAADLQKLLQALVAGDGTPLFNDKRTIDTMFEPTLYYPETNIPRIANGLFYLPSKSQRVYGHGGNTMAFSSSFYIDRKERTGVLVLANMANESTFTAGIPEIVFGEYTHVENDGILEDSSQWKGIYELALVPRHGFSKVYGLFSRIHVKQSGSHDVMLNELLYSQLAPGIYKTQEDVSMYSVDVYSEQPHTQKMLSNTYSDLLYVPYYKHFLEWAGIILALLAVLFSLFYIVIAIVRRIRYKKRLNIVLIIPHVSHLLLLTNICWITYQTLSMTSYSFLKPFLFCNLIYMGVVLVNGGFLIGRMKSHKSSKYEKVVSMLTMLTIVILCANILYWEFY